ncbi:hypothetical protein FOA52_012331 [Chlamydomonas sp. UWO 241]|nr:hypothetical protein FOA52_012331 [Chlamydomonas sp. UWO 241]
MPRVGLGTFKSGGPELAATVAAALAAGIRHIDTASIYKNQAVVGQAVRASTVPRSEVFITSKVSPYEHGTAAARAACVAMLKQLDTGYVDLVLVHWPGAQKTPPESERNSQLRMETWRVLEEFHSQGKFRAIGVSNYEESHLAELLAAAHVLPAVNQIEVHPRRPSVALRRACREAGVAVLAYASLGSGHLLDNPVVTGAAAGLGVTPAQLLLRWGLVAGCAVIPKTVNPGHVGAFAEGELLGTERWGSKELSVSRGLAASATPSVSQLPKDMQVIPLPALSHRMTHGRLVKWHKRPGDCVAYYDVLMEVEVDDLVEAEFKVGDFAGTVTLLVESQEEGFLAQILVPEGPDAVRVGAPVATFCDTAEGAAAAAAPGAPTLPTTDVYDESQPHVNVLPWQSFLKTSTREVKCMG